MMCYIKFNLNLSLLCVFLNQILYLCIKVATIATNINIEDMRSFLFIALILVSIMMEAKIRKPAVAGSFYADDAKELRQDVRDCFSGYVK